MQSLRPHWRDSDLIYNWRQNTQESVRNEAGLSISVQITKDFVYYGEELALSPGGHIQKKSMENF